MIKLSDYLMDRIADAGVRHVFFVPGGAAMHLNDSLGRSQRLTFVSNLHEQASAIASEAYAKVTNNLGVTLVTAGPGGTNAVTGVAGAWLDSTPCLVVSGQVKRADLKGALRVRQIGVQEIDITAIVAPITKYAVTVTDPESIRYHFEKAVHLALSGRPGPVWLDIPLDVQAAPIDPARLAGFEPEPERAADSTLAADVARAIAVLESARRPLFLAGNGIRLAHGQTQFRDLIERLQIPVLATWLAIDLIAETHPLYLGRPGAVAPRGANFAVQNADALVAVGARMDLVLTGYARENFARSATKVIVDVDRGELAKAALPKALPICADARAFLSEMLRQWGGRGPLDRPEWTARCRDWKTRYPIVLAEHRAQESPVSVYGLADILSEALEDGDVIVSGSSGSGIEIFLHAFRVKDRQRIIHTTALGAMGFALPASIGACLASGGRRTIVVDGDGGFQFNVQELETVARLNLPIKYFILDNSGYSSIRASQRNYFGKVVAADAASGQSLPDLARIAEAWRLPFRRIENQSDLRARIRDLLVQPGPLLCDVVVIPDEDRVPRISSRPMPDGSMVSTPIEDLFPYLPRDEFEANMAAGAEESAPKGGS